MSSSIPDFSKSIDRRASDSVKWNKSIIEQLGGNPEAIPLWVADMDFPIPGEVIQALHNRVAHGVLGYPANLEATIQALQTWLLKRYQWEVEKSWVCQVPGMLTGISIALQALARPGDGVILQTPAYRPFFDIIENNELVLKEHPLKRKGNHFIEDMKHFELLAKDPATKFFILCSPHNPAGRVWDQDELLQLAKICSEHNIVVISDEIHADLTFSRHTHHPFSRIAEAFPELKTITCMAPSKTFNIAGEHYASLIIPNTEIRTQVKKQMKALMIGNPGVLIAEAAIAAYTHGEPWLEAVTAYCEENMQLVDEFFQKRIPELTLITPEASFIAFIDAQPLLPLLSAKTGSNYTKEHSKGILTHLFAEEAGVLLHDGGWFGDKGLGYLRINYATQRTLLLEVLERMANTIDALRKV